MSSITTVEYTSDRRADLFRLYEQVWGSHMPAEEWEWWFDRNPAGAPLIRLAEEDGRLVGVAAMSFYRVLVDGDERRLPVPLHVATHPAHRGRGIFTRLESENETAGARDSAVAITFPNAASRHVFVSQLGWRDLPGPRLWAALGLRRRASGVEEVERFGAEADELWRATARGSTVVRDATYLNWRYADAPRPYRLFRCDDGLAVVGHRSRRGREVAFLAELVGGSRGLVLHCVREARAALFLAAGAHPGFVPTSKRILFMGKQLRPDGRLPEDWVVRLGDGDSW